MVRKNRELIIIFIVTLIYNLVIPELSLDEVWNYGFCYNVLNGLVPYKDFNMIITPLYPYIGALFLKIGGDGVINFHIFNTLILILIFCYMRRNISNLYYVLYLLLLSVGMPNYSLLCILFIYILIDLEDMNKKDYMIGIVLGLVFLTKQNIGLLLCIPTIFLFDIKRIWKRIKGILLIVMCLLLYLIINNTLSEFIDYCFLGLSSFSKDNMEINYICMGIIIILGIYLLYRYIKIRDIKILYVICFMGMAYPIVDKYHFIIGIIPAIGYILENIKVKNNYLWMVKKINIIFLLCSLITSWGLGMYEYKDNKYIIFSDLKVWKYRKVDSVTVDTTKEIVRYLKDKNKEEEIFIINPLAYLYKQEAGIPISGYDLLNNGNLGKNGSDRIIKEIDDICRVKECSILISMMDIDGEIKGQYSKEIIKYIDNNYKRVDMVSYFYRYKY